MTTFVCVICLLKWASYYHGVVKMNVKASIFYLLANLFLLGSGSFNGITCLSLPFVGGRNALFGITNREFLQRLQVRRIKRNGAVQRAQNNQSLVIPSTLYSTFDTHMFLTFVLTSVNFQLSYSF